MRDLAVISKIQKIEPIPDRDRIELATVENYQVIVGKGEFKVGDMVVYCFYDTVLPIRPEFEFLRPRCYSKLYDGFRIRNMKMARVYSSGIIFPLSILPERLVIKEGMNVEKELEIRKYDPEEFKELKISRQSNKFTPFQKWMIRHFRLYRRFKLGKRIKSIPYPETVQKSDETNIQKIFNAYKSQFNYMKFYKTEKLEGQAATYLTIGKRKKYHIYSHNVHKNPKGNGNWEIIGRKLDMENLLKSLDKNYAIQGEICGPGIQLNIYNLKELTFFVYKVTESDTGNQLNYEELCAFCRDNNLAMVPVLETNVKLPDSVENTLKDAEGKSVLNNSVQREGIVWRSMSNQHISFKAKSKTYAVWFENKMGTE